MKKLLKISVLLLAAVLMLGLAGCDLTGNNGKKKGGAEPGLPNLTIRNNSSYDLTNVSFSGMDFGDIPKLGKHATKQLREIDVNNSSRITLTRGDTGTIYETVEARTYFDKDETWVINDNTVLEGVGNLRGIYYKLNHRILLKKVEETIYESGVENTQTYSFDKSYPATIEIYALGGGGGGQGGHNETTWASTCGNGVGGGGGGGGAAYMRLSAEEPVLLQIHVGGGGSGGNAYTDNWGFAAWNTGAAGRDGGTTSVKWAAKNITLTANGGIRGGHNRTGAGSGNSGGGSGGGASAAYTSTLVTRWVSANGAAGSNGNDRGSNGGYGGEAGIITDIDSAIFSFIGSSRGKGGKGGFHKNRGDNGGNGQVIILATWWEEE